VQAITASDRSHNLTLFPPATATGDALIRRVREKAKRMTVHYRTQAVGDVEVFYREAGPKDAPVILLLHGYPTASHMFRDLIPRLESRFRLIAPDLPGFGQTKAPPRGTFDYTFDNLAGVIDDFTRALGLTRYAIYIRSASPRSSAKTATRMRKAWALFGRCSANTGSTRARRIATPAA
jgi:alpha-beta hydrolase superfamily lysophospholipase